MAPEGKNVNTQLQTPPPAASASGGLLRHGLGLGKLTPEARIVLPV